ncbi:MAG: cupin domain-containing protein [Planctomycetaceae bacterium]
MTVLSADLTGLCTLALDDAALDRLAWRAYGKGVRLAKLAREGEGGIVLYRVDAAAPRDAFLPHIHTGGEAYFVLKGVIADETGRYGAGSFVWLPPASRHRPWCEGETVVLVLWPSGVAVAQE